MRVTAELSLYPMHEGFLPTIQTFIEAVRGVSGVEIVVNQMSTQLRGELVDVIRAVERALAQSFDADGPRVLVAKFINADLPIGEAPDLGDSRIGSK